MKQLSKECIEVIENEAECRYPVATHIFPNDSPYVGSKKTFIHGINYALTNPSIYEKANLVSKEDMFAFIKWRDVVKRSWIANYYGKTEQELYNMYAKETQLYQQFKNQLNATPLQKSIQNKLNNFK